MVKKSRESERVMHWNDCPCGADYAAHLEMLHRVIDAKNSDCSYFLTLDAWLLENREKVEELAGVKIRRPTELLHELEMVGITLTET